MFIKCPEHIPGHFYFCVIVNTSEIITTLTNFRWADKYATFSDALPSVSGTGEDQREVISDILNQCCSDLINLFEKKKKPTKAELKDAITKHMDRIALAKVSADNRDFGIELCWYLSEKVGLNFKSSSDSRLWGFWKVESGKVKTVTGIRRKKPRQ